MTKDPVDKISERLFVDTPYSEDRFGRPYYLKHFQIACQILLNIDMNLSVYASDVLYEMAKSDRPITDTIESFAELAAKNPELKNELDNECIEVVAKIRVMADLARNGNYQMG